MSYSLNSEQLQLRDLIRDFFGGEVTSTYLRKVITHEAASDNALAQKLSELDLFTLFAGDEGSGLIELGIIAHESGRCLLPEPLIDNLLAGPYLARIIGQAGNSPKASQILEKSLHAVIARSSGKSPINITLKGDTCVIEGQADFVRGASSADCIIVLTDQAAAVVDLANSAEQISIAGVPGLDSTIKLASVTFSKAQAWVLEGVKPDFISELLSIVRACEVSGACEKVVEMTAEYVKTRKQFDIPVGAFQAVQHRLADMLLQAEAIAACAYFASWSADNDPKQQSLAANAAISYACENGPEIIEGSIQLHGGIGFTWEFDLHLYLRRVRAISALYGLDDQGYINLLGLVNQN